MKQTSGDESIVRRVGSPEGGAVRQWVRRLWVAAFLLMPGVAVAAEPAAPRLLENDESRLEALVRAVLERPDAVMKAGGRVWLPPADGRSETWYTIRGYQGWQLPGGAEFECLGLEDREARRRRNQELISETGERPNLTEPYRGLLLGLRRSGDGQAPRVVRRPLHPEAMFGELIRISKPLQDPEHGWVVPVEHSALVFEPTVSRRLHLESWFSLQSLERVGQREVSEIRYHHDTGEIEQFRDGQIVGVQQYDPGTDARKRTFEASGVVSDEEGEPIQGVKVKVEWTKVISTSMTTSKWKSLEELHETDADGRFTQRITGGATTCQVAIYHPGYLPMRFEFRSGEGERHIQLVPVPQFTAGEQDFIYDIVYPDKQRRSYTVGPLLEKPGVGLVIGGPADRYAGTWTTNRDEADVWIEVVDQQLEEKVREESDYAASLPKKTDWVLKEKSWLVSIQGLRGTELAPTSGPPQEGVPDSLRYWEAATVGYGADYSGVAPLGGNRKVDFTLPVLPTAYFVRKDGRYGYIERVAFRFGSNLVGERKWVSGAGWQGDRVFEWAVRGWIFVMQGSALGHPFLLPKSALEKVPHWAE